MDKINHCINHNRFIPIDTEELSALELIGKGAEKTNELVDKSNNHEERITNNEKNKVSFDDMKEKYKFNNETDIDYRGKWFGLDEPTLSDEGMRSQVQKNRDDIIKANEQLDSIVTSLVLFPRLNGENDDTNRIKRALEKCKGTLYIPSGEYIVNDSITLPQGVEIKGQRKTFFQSGKGLDKLTIIKTNIVGNLFNLSGGNNIENLTILYVNQTYGGVDMIDVGTTFNITGSKSVSLDTPKGCSFNDVSVVGGVTIINSVDYSDFTNINNLSFTPNTIRHSIILDRMYDISRLENIHCNQNILWQFRNTNVISDFSEQIKLKLKEVGKLIKCGRVDELIIDKLFCYGVAYPFEFSKIGSDESNGGITISNTSCDMCIDTVTIDSPLTPFCLSINGLKSINAIKNGGSIIKLLDKCQGTKIVGTNIIGNSGGYTSNFISFSENCDNNRIILEGNFSNYNNTQPTKQANYYMVNGFTGSQGLTPNNYTRKKDIQYLAQSYDNKSMFYNGSVSIPINANDITKTQTVTLPFTCLEVPNVYVNIVGFNCGGNGHILTKVQGRTLNSFEIKIDWVTGDKAISNGVVNLCFTVFAN